MKFKCNIYCATLYQVLIPLLLLWLTRFAFYWHNADIVGEISPGRLFAVALGGLQFDVVAVAYANALFIVMRMLPFKFVMKRWWRRIAFAIYAVANSVLLLVNIGDIAFFRFNNGHMQLDAFLSFLNFEMAAVAMSYFTEYWWAFAAIAVMIVMMLWLASRVEITGVARRPMARVGLFLLAAALTFVGMRGNVFGRPIGIDRAGAIAGDIREINVLLNTPFCIMRSANYSQGLIERSYFSEIELESLRSSVHDPSAVLEADSIKRAVNGKNIVLIVLEGGGQVWFDSLNVIDDDQPRGLMPFLDSLSCRSMALTSTFCTGVRTVEGLASIIGGVPTFGPINWMATKYAALPVDAPARKLSEVGYDTRFFIGAPPSSFSLGSLAAAMGFKEITGVNDVDLGVKKSTWGIYDYFMGEYVARELTGMQSPFFAAWLTLDLHSPFKIPDDWDDTGYRPTSDPMERCVEYTDRSLRRFFETAATQPWFDNTLFVITSDHGFRDFTDPKYNGAFIYGHVPFLLYTPDGSLTPGKHAYRPMAQFDIAPTLLWLAGYDKPHIAVGTNYFDDSKPHYGLIMRNDQWHVVSDRYLVRLPFDGMSVDAVFDIVADQQMSKPLDAGEQLPEVDDMVKWFRAFIQDYSARANSGRLTISKQ